MTNILFHMPPTTTLLHWAVLVLTLDNFLFDGQHCEQVSGVAMETKIGLGYTDIFVGYVEKFLRAMHRF